MARISYAVFCLKKKRSTDQDDPFLRLAVSALAAFGLAQLGQVRRKRGAAGASRVKSVRTPLELGLLVVDAPARAGRFLEKPGWGHVLADTISRGVFGREP